MNNQQGGANMKIEEILDYKLKKLLPYPKYSSIQDIDKKFVLAQAKSKIQAYCHRRDIPVEAYYIWADIAVEILKNNIESLFKVDTMSEEELVKRVTSISTGDTNISIDSGNTNDTIDTGYKANSNDDAIIGSFARQLPSFRKFPAGCGVGLDGI